MINRLNALKEYLGTHLFTIAGVVAIIMLAIGYIVFYVSSIAPAIQNHDRLATQLTDAQKLEGTARGLKDESPQSLQTRVAKAQDTYTNAISGFLTSDQASRLLDSLYQYARASGVTIVDMQIPATPTPLPTPIPTQTRQPTVPPTPSPVQSGSSSSTKPSPSPTTAAARATPTITLVSPSAPQSKLYSIRPLRLRAQGTSRQLIDFVSRIQELTKKGIVITNFNITGNEATLTAALSMDFSLYVYTGSPTATPAKK